MSKIMDHLPRISASVFPSYFHSFCAILARAKLVTTGAELLGGDGETGSDDCDREHEGEGEHEGEVIRVRFRPLMSVMD
jgi:hypothetical protein